MFFSIILVLKKQLMGSRNLFHYLLFFIVYSFVVFLAIIPIVLTRNPPLLDYPNHLARMRILIESGRDPVLAQFYSVEWYPLPNLAMDILVPALSNVIPLEIAGRCVIVLSLVLLMTGTLALHGALFRRLSYWPLIAVFFLYDRIFVTGTLNYVLGIGYLLFAFAAWIWLRDLSLRRRLFLFSILNTILYFIHLFAFGLFILITFAYEIKHLLSLRNDAPRDAVVRIAVNMATFLMPAAMFIGFAPMGSVSEGVNLLRALPTENFVALAKNYYWMLVERPAVIADAIYDSSLLIDSVRWIFIVCYGFLVFGLATGVVRLSYQLYWPICFLAALALFGPSELFGGSAVTMRLPIAITMLIIGGSELRLRKTPVRSILITAGTVLFLIRISLITNHWLDSDKIYISYRQAFTQIPVGGKLALVLDNARREPTPVRHIAALAVVDRSAFVPTIFTIPGKQPITYTPAYKRLSEKTEPVLLRRWDQDIDFDMLFSSDILAAYDYLLMLYANNNHSFSTPSTFRPVVSGKGFVLFKIQH